MEKIMYYQVKLNELLNFLGMESLKNNSLFPLVSNDNISKIKSLKVEHLSEPNFLDLVSYIKKSEEKQKDKNNSWNINDTKKVLVAYDIQRWNSLLKIEHNNISLWQNNYQLLLNFDSLEKLKGLRELSNSIYNDKVDILNISMNKELLSIEDIIAINKAINIVSDDLTVIEDNDVTVIIKTELEDIPGAVPYIISEDEVIENSFYNKPLNILDLKRASALFLGSDVDLENPVNLSLSERMLKNSNSPDLVTSFSIMKEVSSDDLTDTDFVSNYLKYAISITRKDSYESTLKDIKERSLSHYENKKEFPLLDLQEIPKEILLDEQNKDLFLKYLGKRHNVNCNKDNFFANSRSMAAKIWSSFASENRRVIHNRKELGFYTPSYKLSDSDGLENFFMGIIKYAKEDSIDVLKYAIETNNIEESIRYHQALIDVMQICTNIYLKKDLPSLQSLSNTIQEISQGRSDDSLLKNLESLIYLYPDDEILNSNGAMRVLQVSYCKNTYFSEHSPDRSFVSLKSNFSKMFRNYLEGSDEEKDDVLFLFRKDIKGSVSGILRQSSFVEKYIIFLTDLDKEMKESPINYKGESYHNLSDLINGINKNPQSSVRDLYLVNAISYISRVEKHYAKRNRMQDKYPSFTITSHIFENIAKIHKGLTEKFELKTNGDYKYKEDGFGIDISDIEFPSIFHLLGKQEYKDIVRDSVKLSVNNSDFVNFYHYAIEHMKNLKNYPDELIMVLNSIGKDAENDEILRKITACWENKDWDFVSKNLDKTRNFRQIVARSANLKNLNLDVVPESVFSELFNMGVNSKESFTKEQLSSPYVIRNLVRNLKIENSINILGRLELSKPINLLLIAEDISNKVQSMSVLKQVSSDLWEYVQEANVKSEDLHEHLKIMFNTMLMDSYAPKSEVKKSKILKV